MSKPKNLKDLLIEELKDIYNAENQLCKALPKMEKKAADEKLKKLFADHLSETEKQIEKLSELEEHLDCKLGGKVCKAMKGLIEEASEVLTESSEDDNLTDIMLIGSALRVEHYEIAAYTTTIEMARKLKDNKLVKLLESILKEETKASEKLCMMLSEEISTESKNEKNYNGKLEMKKPSNDKMNESKKSTLSASTAMALVAALLFGLSTNLTFADVETTKEKLHKEHESIKYDANNTGRNVRDTNDDRVTAEDQDLTGDQTQLLAKLRREIVANDKLSTDAHNIKIVMEGNSVYLRGPVRSVEEREWISTKVSQIASTSKVINELEIVS